MKRGGGEGSIFPHENALDCLFWVTDHEMSVASLEEKKKKSYICYDRYKEYGQEISWISF